MSKKSIRIISMVFTVAIVLALLTSVAFAYSPTNVAPNTTVKGATNIQSVGNGILGIIQVVGTIAAVGIVMVLGIKYMMGSAEEKASYKKTMLPYIIGAVLLFAASNVAQYVFNFAQGV